MLGEQDVWPISIPIGRPPPILLSTDAAAISRHIDAWSQVKVGEVVQASCRYRATRVEVSVPMYWKLRTPGEFVDACGDASVRIEFAVMTRIIEQTDPICHSLLICRRSLWRGKSTVEIIRAASLAMILEPGCSSGRPLRGLSFEGIDTKFFERHERLVTLLLDERFDGEVSRVGLVAFLDALPEGEHWLLVADLDGSLLPFRKMRVRSSELKKTMLPGERLLIVENESCHYQLPTLANTIAVLGSGFDLDWTEADWLASKKVAYWGDIDTWGLRLLARARERIGKLNVLMMTSEVFDQFAHLAGPEKVIAGTEPPVGLSPSEQLLFRQLLEESHGRLEQEFLPESLTRETILNWAINS